MELIEPGSTDCLVVGCDERAIALWESIYFVCHFHLTALAAGEPWTVEDSGAHPAPILMGTNLPPEVMNVRLQQRQNGVMFAVLTTGRDGVQDGELAIRIDLEQARALVSLLERWRPVEQ